jgi:AhpD family alkylhydroperoxidase
MPCIQSVFDDNAFYAIHIGITNIIKRSPLYLIAGSINWMAYLDSTFLALPPGTLEHYSFLAACLTASVPTSRRGKSPMPQRLDYFKRSPEAAGKFAELTQLLNKTPFLSELAHLVTLRASQINGCAFCVDMHVKEARIHGERELRLHHVTVWRESTLFSARERAALEWTEALTRLDSHGVSDELFSRVREQLSEKELADLSFLVITINGWNRLSVAFQAVPGSADKLYGLDKADLH